LALVAGAVQAVILVLEVLAHLLRLVEMEWLVLAALAVVVAMVGSMVRAVVKPAAVEAAE
jgi:hypothetical protein